MITRVMTALSCAFVLAVASGCGADPDPVSDEIGGAVGGFGEILVAYDQYYGGGGEDNGESFSVSASFVRTRDVDPAAARQLFGEDLPLGTSALHDCGEVDPLPSRHDGALAGSLELLDAGELTIRVDNEEARVPDWSFPSVYGVASGVFYGGDDDVGVRYRPGAPYVLSGGGSGSIGGFSTGLTAPEALEVLSVGGADVGVEAARIEVGTPLVVQWTESPRGEPTIVDLTWSQFGLEQRYTCRVVDESSVVLSESLTSRLGEAGVGDIRLTLMRLTRASFRAEGLDEAEAIFRVSAQIALERP